VIPLIRVWTKARPFGTELADVSVGGGTPSAAGVAIGTDPVPYHLDYQLTTVDPYVTARLVVRAGSGLAARPRTGADGLGDVVVPNRGRGRARRAGARRGPGRGGRRARL
jgi:hypothetical protein